MRAFLCVSFLLALGSQPSAAWSPAPRLSLAPSQAKLCATSTVSAASSAARRRASQVTRRGAVLGHSALSLRMVQLGVDSEGLEGQDERAPAEKLGGSILRATELGGGHSVFSDLGTLGEMLGGTGKARMVWQSLRDGQDPWTNEEGVTPKARKALQDHFEEIPRVSTKTVASCGTVKMLVELSDGMEVEAVVIPHQGRSTANAVVDPRTTLCVSSQVGCNRACSFCATGKMGFIRQLSNHEILSQVYHAHQTIREFDLPPLHNIVFMGMGEPLNNFASVKKATELLTNDNCFRIAKNRVTVSTVGPSPSMIRAAGDLSAMLAWSVHAANDDLRKQLVPTTRHSMEELRDTWLDILQSRSKQMSTFMVAVTLMDGINDSPENARELADLLRPFLDQGVKLCVDLIPYNDIGVSGLQRTARDRVTAFQRVLRDEGYACFVRVTRGDDEGAACGQLATKMSKQGVEE